MRRFISAGLGVSLVLLPLMCYTYAKGCEDGVAQYKRSQNFVMTLFSMYVFGVQDACLHPHTCDGVKK